MEQIYNSECKEDLAIEFEHNELAIHTIYVLTLSLAKPHSRTLPNSAMHTTADDLN